MMDLTLEAKVELLLIQTANLIGLHRQMLSALTETRRRDMRDHAIEAAHERFRQTVDEVIASLDRGAQ